MAGPGTDFINFTGTLGQLIMTLFNPYDSESIEIYDEYNINNSAYDGLGGYDYLLMTNLGDALFLTNNVGMQVITNIEEIIAGDGGDIVNLAHSTITYGNVTISGGDGNDILWGNIGNDSIFGAGGNDIINGGPGNDILNGNDNDDRLTGGAGSDTYQFDGGDDVMIEGDDAEINVLQFEAFQNILLADVSFSTDLHHLYITVASLGTIKVQGQYDGAGAGLDTIIFSDGSTFDLRTISNNVAPVAMDDIFSGTEDSDIVGNVLLDNGNSVDNDANGHSLSVVVETITTANGGTVVMLANGDFTYTPADNYEGPDSFDYTVLDGNGGSDIGHVTLTLTGDGITEFTNNGEVINGTNGDDVYDALDGNDTIYGHLGDDVLMGGEGNDVIYGGSNSGLMTVDKDFVDPIAFPGLIEGTNIVNLLPPGDPSLGIANNNLMTSFDSTATITFRKGFAGYNNTLGIYSIAADGTIQSADILWKNVKTAGINTAHTIDLPVGAEGGEFAFFIIADGNTVNNNYSGLNVTGDGNINFYYHYGQVDQRAAKITDDGQDISIVYNDGVKTKILNGYHYHTSERGGPTDPNWDGKTHVVSGLANPNSDDVLRIGFEDLPMTGDADYEDVLFDLNINPIQVDVSEAGDDTLLGGAGNDTLYGEAGDDILLGGSGTDVLHGGLGDDVFLFQTMDGSIDTIADFSGDDVINITDVLEGYDALTDAISDFVQLVDVGSHTEIRVNADGDVGGTFTAIAVVTGGLDATLAQMISSGSMVADQSVAV
jgi:serralysin